MAGGLKGFFYIVYVVYVVNVLFRS